MGSALLHTLRQGSTWIQYLIDKILFTLYVILLDYIRFI